jgi:hypothetical protein
MTKPVTALGRGIVTVPLLSCPAGCGVGWKVSLEASPTRPAHSTRCKRKAFTWYVLCLWAYFVTLKALLRTGCLVLAFLDLGLGSRVFRTGSRGAHLACGGNGSVAGVERTKSVFPRLSSGKDPSRAVKSP